MQPSSSTETDFMRNLLIAFSILALLSGCSDAKLEDPGTPKSQRQQRREHNGNLTGDEGGFLLAGGAPKGAEGGALGVNSFLWRATLDTLSFMPLASADPFGGVIITDWYEDPKTPGERFKVNALILDKALRADGVKITVFKQKQEKGAWRDKKVDGTLQKSLEDTILTRARELRVTQVK
jgi:hypothetical protein